MPDDLIAKIHKASLFNQGFTTTELVAAALLDMDIHSMQTYADFDPAEFEKYAMATRRGLIPQIEPRYRLPYFSHIFNGGYSSGYYFYLWAEVLDKDAFAAFKSGRDICDKQLAHSFRYDLLAQGGQHDGMDMYRKFRGADPDKTAMLRARACTRSRSCRPTRWPAKRPSTSMPRPQRSKQSISKNCNPNPKNDKPK